MSTSTTRARIARGTVLAAGGALTLGLLPGIASASPPPPPASVSYIDCASNDTSTCDQILWANDAAAAGTAVPLTPATGHYQTYSYDVSASGASWVVGLRHGPVVDDSYDSTTGLVFTHRGANPGGQVTSRVLATSWDATPAISTDGTKVWWLSGGSLYRFTVTSFDETTGAITGVTLKLTAPLFTGTASEIPWNLAIAPNGVSAAVLFHNDSVISAGPPVVTGHKDRVVAALISATATGGYFERKYDTTTADKTAPSPNTFTFADNSTLLYDEYQVGSTSTPVSAVRAVIPAAGPHVVTPAVANPALDDFYDTRALAGTFWAWKDTFSGTTFVDSELGSTPDPTVAPTLPLAPRADGEHTYRYVPSAAVPAPLTSAVNRAAAHAHLVLSTRSVATGARPAFWGYNLYLQPTLGTTYVEAKADEVDRGVLRWAAVGETTAHTLVTSGSTAFQTGAATYLGYLPPLSRNTYVWWTYQGDYLTAPGSSAKVFVSVAPRVSVRTAKSGVRTAVAGATTRHGGAVILYKVSGTKQTRVATTTINAVGAYAFGRRALAKGTYRVVAVADRYWAAGRSANFKV
jgi:hypothetical protein